MHEVVGDPASSRARRKFARRHLGQTKPTLLQQFLWHDDNFVPRQPRAHDRMRTGYIVGETIAGHHLNAAPVLFVVRYPVRLEQNLHVWVLARLRARNGLRDTMLARL